MPAIIGPVQVFNVAQGNLLFGDCAVISLSLPPNRLLDPVQGTRLQSSLRPMA